ncbi:MAG TPA: PKD domain-containing protein, partial [Nitrospira sp.]|nr:PKD domain-containing protein [Nitrospira sp.]
SDDSALGLALDSGGNAVVSGVTGSSTFPLAGTPFQSTRVAHDYFVTKLNSSGTALILSTFFGGVGDDFGAVVALDQFDNIYLTGPINSCRIPNFSHPLQIDRCSLGAPFLHVPVAKLDAGGSSLLGLVVFTGSTGVSAGLGIATDLQGNAYVAGLTRASDFTTQNPFQSTYGGGPEDGFVARISFRPLANSGPDQSKPEGTLVTLDGTGSTGASLTYIWTQVAGPTAALTGATTGSPTFIAPHVSAAGGTTTFELVVCEGTSSNCSDPDAVNVHITNVNHPPVAEAGPDQTVQEGSPVILDGSASYDPDVEPLTYTWLQIFGPPVTLAYPHSATPSFTAPPVGASGGQVDFELIVTDARGLNHSDYLSVFISNVNQPPASDAGPDQTRNENTLVTLDGNASSDPDLDTLHFSWSQTGGPVVSLTGANTSNPTFTAPNVGPGGAVLTFQLVVNDGQASGGADTVHVAIQDVNDPPVCTLAQPSVSVLWPPNHTMVAVSIMGVTDPNNSAVTISYPRITQDEPINGLGDGDTSPDAAESGNNILLRAERAGSGNGRVYVVQFRATDQDGASCTGTVKVSVPKSIKDTAVDSGQNYNSFGP